MNEFIKISRYAGMREDLVQAGGGNSSYKVTPDKMVIKASGYQLADVTENNGFSVVNPMMIRDAFINNDDLNAITEEKSKEILKAAFVDGERPSIETFLHSISGKYTLHTHPIVVNALTCRKDGVKELKKLFPDALMIPYATPGVELAKTFFNAYKSASTETRQVFDITFLQNHGLVVSADTAEEVIRKTEDVLEKIERYLDIDYSAYHQITEIWNHFKDRIVWCVTDYHIIEAYHCMAGMWEHAFCPDCVVFLGKKILHMPTNICDAVIQGFQEQYGMPVMVSYRDHLYLLADSVKKALETQSVMSFSAQVMVLNKGIECKLLSNDEQDFLLNWDAEKYRKSMK